MAGLGCAAGQYGAGRAQYQPALAVKRRRPTLSGINPRSRFLRITSNQPETTREPCAGMIGIQPPNLMNCHVHSLVRDRGRHPEGRGTCRNVPP